MRNLYSQKRLDELVLHFMSFENDMSTFPKFESYMLEEADCPGAEPIDEIEAYPFMAELICNVQERGKMFFPTNRFSVEGLEKDAYIQALIKSGYWVCAVTYGDCGYITVRVGKK
jgi:hypothetical protein